MMKKLLILASLIFVANTSYADDKSLIDNNITLLELTEKASIELMPNMFTSTVEFTNMDASAKDVQRSVMKLVHDATSTLEGRNIKYRLGSFSTYQDYKTKKFVARQTISLDLADKAKLEQLTSKIAKKGKITSTSSYLTEEKRQENFEQLFETAYDKAYQKAEFISSKLKADKFTVTNLKYYMDNYNHERPLMARSMMANAEMAKVKVDNSKKTVSLSLTMNIAITPNK